MSKRIFILDDDPKRQSTFRAHYQARYPGCRVYSAYTAAEAIDLLMSEEAFDIVHLDHDLGGEVYQASGPGTGYEVASVMAQCWPTNPHRRIIIHSYHNRGGVQAMLDCFVRKAIPCEYRPFGVWEEASDGR